ncbi:MAG: hypothetical protein U0798_15040 [Gemmataceae bacterium]
MNRGQTTYVRYFAYNSTSGQPQTGDVANHTIRIQKDNGSLVAPTNTPAEVSATYAKGVYILQLTSAETDCQNLLLSGVSSTANVLIDPVVYESYQLPIAVAGAAGGLQTVGTAITLPPNPPVGFIASNSFAVGAIDAASIAAGAITTNAFEPGAITSVVAPNLDASVDAVGNAVVAVETSLAAITTQITSVSTSVENIPNALGSRVVEGTTTYDQVMKLNNAMASGGIQPGATNGQFLLKSPDGTKNRVSFSVNDAAQSRTVTATDLS